MSNIYASLVNGKVDIDDLEVVFQIYKNGEIIESGSWKRGFKEGSNLLEMTLFIVKVLGAVNKINKGNSVSVAVVCRIDYSNFSYNVTWNDLSIGVKGVFKKDFVDYIIKTLKL